MFPNDRGNKGCLTYDCMDMKKLNNNIYVRKKNDLPVPCAYEQEWYGAEICPGEGLYLLRDEKYLMLIINRLIWVLNIS